MAASISVLVRCGFSPKLLVPTIESVDRQAGAAVELLLLTDSSVHTKALQWITAYATKRAIRHVHTDGGPGNLRNAGMRQCQGAFAHFLDAGDLLSPNFHERCAQWLVTHPEHTLVTTGLLQLGPGTRQQLTIPAAIDADMIASDLEAAHGASMFRRSVWEQLHGFDETLPVLDDAEFFLRVVETGCGVVIPGVPLIRPIRRNGPYRLAWKDPVRAEAAASIVTKHARTFSVDPARVLVTREERLMVLAERGREVQIERDHHDVQIATLAATAAGLRAQLGAAVDLDFGDLRRTTPLSRDWGYERGTPVDRHYIEAFLAEHTEDIRGHVLEVQESDYTRKFGGDRVSLSDVVDLDPSNTRATIVSDLRYASNIPEGRYDCIILTQTLHVIDNMAAVVSECARILKPGGVLLATLPSSSRVCLEYGHGGDFWRVTSAGARRVFEHAFSAENVAVESLGNALVSTAFLYGLGASELTAEEYAAHDPYFPSLITVRAVKSPEDRRSSPSDGRHGRADHSSSSHSGGAILAYHRVANPVSDVHRLAVSPEEFRVQMAYIRAHYCPMPLIDFADAALAGALPLRAIAVTLDDGYRDNSTTASPILSAFGIPATFFITTEDLDSDAYEFWWDALERVLLGGLRGLGPNEIHVDLPGGRDFLALGTAEERVATYWHLYHAIVGESAYVRCEVLSSVSQALRGPGPTGSATRMNRNEVRELASRRGHTIGAHTVHHLMLTRQPVDVLRAEIEDCQRELEGITDRPVTTFAYPFGAVSDEVKNALTTAGFKVAVRCEGSSVPPVPDCLELPRLDPTGRGDEPFDSWLRRCTQSTPDA